MMACHTERHSHDGVAPPEQAFGAAVRALRQGLRLGQAQFGRLLYPAQDPADARSQVSRLERGKQGGSLSLLETLRRLELEHRGLPPDAITSGWSRLQAAYRAVRDARHHSQAMFGQTEPGGFEAVILGPRGERLELKVLADGTALVGLPGPEWQVRVTRTGPVESCSVDLKKST